MRRIPSGAAVGVAVLAGAMVGVQGRINGELATRTGSALETAAASFAIGLAMLAAAMPWRAQPTRRLLRTKGRWWWWLGGFGGAFLVSMSAHGVPQIGVALVTVCLVAGTTAGALLTDQLGLGPSGKHPATFWRFAGVAIVVAAVAIGAVGESGSFKPALFLLLILAGAASAVQQAANGQLRVISDVVVASFVSFLGGTLVLVIATIVAGDLHLGLLPSAPWLYLGGPLGVFYILAGAATVRSLGVLRFVLGVVAGQLIAAVVIDAAWPAPGISLRPATVIGALVTVIGVWLSGRDQGHDSASEESPEDVGEADADLAAALEGSDLEAVRRRLPAARVLVPVTATGEEATGAEMAVPRLIGKDGRHALPIFTSYDALRAWQPDARPVPMSGEQALVAAVSEGYQAVVIDVAGPITQVLEIEAAAD
ncbi:MAG: DMT family transporter [Frankiaceae bacterium]|nr:DMT family transporter [Frankiaceae bacterium]MBV9870713.1 DMT family transporter [Frankiaceae bacterium]